MTDYIVLQLFFWICSFLVLMQFLGSDNAVVKYFVRIKL